MAAKKKSDKDLYESQINEKQIHVNDAEQFIGEDAALIGGFATITKGDHEGTYGVVVRALTFDSKGWPKTVLFRTRDDDAQDLQVNYADLAKAEAGRR